MTNVYNFNPNKSNSQATIVDGIKFKNSKELENYLILKSKLKTGKITEAEFWKQFQAPSPGSKYHSEKTTVNGIEFDSNKEANRYSQLKLLEKAGRISELERQKEFVLIPTQREPSTIENGKEKLGKVIERKCSYYADFFYKDLATGQYKCEDTKGVRTQAYVIKKKLMLYVYGIKIIEL